MPTVPGSVDDGNWNVAQQSGVPVYDFPFSYRGDFKTFTAEVTMTVNVGSWKQPQSMKQRWFAGLGRGYLVDFTKPVATTQGLMEYKEIYASVPLTGIEYGSSTANIQIPHPATDPTTENATISSYSDTFNAQLVYEYSVFKPLPQILYTRLILQPDPTTGLNVIVVQGTALGIDAPGRALVQNTTSKIWKGKIFERLSVFINYQPLVPLASYT